MESHTEQLQAEGEAYRRRLEATLREEQGERIDKLEAQTERDRLELAELRAKLAEARYEAEAADIEVRKWKDKADEANVNGLRAQIEALNHRIKTTTAMAGEMEEDLQAAEKKAADAEEALSASRAAFEELEDSMSQQAAHYTAELEAKEEALVELAETQLQSNVDIRNLRNQKEKLGTQLEDDNKAHEEALHEKDVKITQLLAEAAAAQEPLILTTTCNPHPDLNARSGWSA